MILFEDIFEVIHKDKDGVKFDKVSRFECKSDLYEMDLVLDVNVDIYTLKQHDKFALAIASTLNKDGTADDGQYDASIHTGRPSLMDEYEYVMYGKVYKYKESAEKEQAYMKVEVYVSFGGLLMMLSGDARKLEELELDSNVYLLIRKV